VVDVILVQLHTIVVVSGARIRFHSTLQPPLTERLIWPERIAIAAVNGQFIASISRGRKVYEVIVYSMISPAAYCLVWFCIWGGVGLRQSRQALELKVLGETHFNNNSAHFLVSGSEYCYDVPQDDLLVGDEVIFTNHLKGVTPVCIFDEANFNSASFNVLGSFSRSFQSAGLSSAMAILFIAAIVLFYMTSAGAASLIVDKLASSGRKNNHLARRMFWLVTVGALATTLLSSGGAEAVGVLQAAMIVCGLPCAVLLFYIMQSITLFCQSTVISGKVKDYTFPEQPEFSFPVYGGMYNCFEYMASLGKVNVARVDLGMHQPSKQQVKEFFKGLFVPFVSLHQVLAANYPSNVKINAAVGAAYALLYVGWIILLFASRSRDELRGLVWTLFFAAGGMLAFIRQGFRNRYNLRSNYVGDVLASAFFWPQVLSQMRLQPKPDVRPNKKQRISKVYQEVLAQNIGDSPVDEADRELCA
jgi:BCCT, betaine/carnitine/choline family transporter